MWGEDVFVVLFCLELEVQVKMLFVILVYNSMIVYVAVKHTWRETKELNLETG